MCLSALYTKIADTISSISFKRRVEDSNLWTDYSISALAGRHFKPLSQLS